MQGKAKKLSLSGILLALTVITLFVESIVPVNKLSLYILSSFFVSVVIIEFGPGAGWLFYLASCILAFITIQDKMALIPYVTFFGLYGIIKYYIERIDKLILEYVIKLIFTNIIVISLYYLFKQLFLPEIDDKFPVWILLIAGQAVFLLYDYIFSRFIGYYGTKLKKVLKID